MVGRGLLAAAAAESELFGVAFFGKRISAYIV